jgi:hypothetical protein
MATVWIEPDIMKDVQVLVLSARSGATITAMKIIVLFS